ncbi:hypothetical protein BH11BAC4_BH11BAC4_21030 [soil metagenome]
MANENELSGEESLAIIHQMIAQAKTNITDSGLSWLLWGGMLFLSSVSTFFLVNVGYANIYISWNIFGLITIILLTYDIVKPTKKPVRTYLDDILRMVDIGFMICIFAIIFSINANAVSPGTGFGFFLMIFAFLMLIQGGALKSRSLIIGAVVNWAGAIAVFMIKDFQYTMLIMAGAVLIGYIVPGLILRAQYKRNNIPKSNLIM